ncbi:MAG: 16S rRNA (uracil(1498)-N(3))-methyltransferase [Firmicutes bacterium]|nr:16S rRNA (uracil(1498)-N(3))-methyltransferase [Bacillota bacterium]
MSRFFITDKNNIFSDSIIITGEDVNHIKNVLRCHVGDPLVLCDGNGTDFQVRIDSFRQGQITTKIVSISKNRTEPPFDIVLFQGIPKGDKMDYIVQKGVELGVKRIIPIMTERTVLKFNSEEDKKKKKTRWQKISLEAAKQCNRGVVPEIEVPIHFKESLEYLNNFDFTLIPYEKEKDRTPEMKHEFKRKRKQEL